MRYIFIANLYVLLLGCRANTASTYEGFDLDTVVVHVDKPIQKNVKDYFSQLEIIPLETNKESAIGQIDRIIMDNDLLYILDRARGAILIFNKEGDFLQKIERRGRGPEEYISLLDFSLNRNSGRLSVLTDIPAGIKRYDPNGRFINSEELSVYFKEITNNKGQDVLFNTRKQNEDHHYLWFKNGTSYTKKVPFEKTNDIYPHGPLIVESQYLCFTRRYDHVIMKIENEDAVPVYYLDFGAHWLSDRKFADNENDKEFIISESRKNTICHTVYMIRDMKDYLVFKTNLSGFVIYNKQNRTADYLRMLQDDEIGYMCANYFAHDGDDRKMLFTLSPNDFQILSKLKGTENNSVNRRRILDIASTIEYDANPVLLLYTFK